MKARMDFRKASPPGEKAMAALRAFVHSDGSTVAPEDKT